MRVRRQEETKPPCSPGRRKQCTLVVSISTERLHPSKACRGALSDESCHIMNTSQDIIMIWCARCPAWRASDKWRTGVASITIRMQSSAGGHPRVDAAALAVQGGVKLLAAPPILEPFHRRKAATQLLARPTPNGCSGASKVANRRERRPPANDEDHGKSN
jgi:hypothetical protein